MPSTVVVRPVAARVAPRRTEARIQLRRELWRGVMAMLPLLAGVAPLGLLVGAAIAAHSEPGAALAGTWLVYGASAHLALLQLTDEGAGLATIAVTCLLINARLAVYAATLGHHWRGERLAFKAVMAFTIVDPSFVVGDDRYREPGAASAKRWFYVTAAATLWFGWSAAIGVGMVFGVSIGDVRVLAMALPVCQVAMIAPALRDRPGRAAIATSVAVAVSTAGLPSGTGLLLAIVAGSIVGAAVGGRTS